MATTTVYPNGDGSKANWTDHASGTTSLFTNIAEGTATPNDADFVQTASQNSSIFFLLGDMPGDFGTPTGVTIRLRLARSLSKGDYKTFVDCQLLQGDETTAITAAATIIDSTTIMTYSYNPTITGATARAAWDGMRLRIKSGTGSAGLCRIYAAQVEITYTPAPGRISRTTPLTGLGGSGRQLLNPRLE